MDKETLRRQYIDMLGFPLNDCDTLCQGPVPYRSERLSAADGLEISRLQFAIPGGILFSGLYLKPSGAGKKALLFAISGMKGTPEVLCAEGALSTNYNAFVRRVLTRGLCVFAPQMLLWDPQRFGQPYDRAKINDRLRQLGGSIAALELFCLRRAADTLSVLDEIDENRMGVAGLSYGGMYALAFGAVDTRMKATLCAGFFNDRTKYLYDWTYRDQARIGLDAEQAMLIADRKLYVELGEADATFALGSALSELERVKDYLWERGDPSFLHVKIHPGNHAFDVSDDGVRFLRKELQVGE